MKKLFAFLFVLMLGVPSFSQDVASNPLDFTYGGIVYTIIDDVNHTCITKSGESRMVGAKIETTYGNDISGSITIPAKVSNGTDEYTVTAIGSYSFNKASDITISEGITSIYASAFTANQALTNISIPSTVTSIGNYAFSACSNLTTVNLPEGLTSIGNNTFSSSGIQSLKIPETVTYIGNFAFSNCKYLQEINIPNSVVQIGENAFQNCSSMTSLTLSENLSSIPAFAFSRCMNLTSLVIPANVSSIGEYAFNCPRLTEIISYSKSIPAISYNSFENINYTGAVLKVYKSALPAYQKSTLWSNFVNIEPIQISPEGISVTPTTLTLSVGLSGRLTAALTPEEAIGEITWSAGDMSVEGCVSVDETGKVIGRKVGTATVTASCGDFTATCNVVVQPNPSEAVIINPLPQDLYVGDTASLTATVFPTTITPSITWTSSNTSVATIDETTGVLTAIAPGATVISAKNDNVTGRLAITVYEVLPESVTLDKETLTLRAGDTAELKATVSPKNVTYPTVTWESSDPNVVIVADGNVTAVGTGSATIRAMCGGLTANCEVTVEPTPATAVELSQTSATLKATQTLQLSATVKPETATDKSVVWTTDNAAVATVSEDGTVTAISVGSATITATCGSVAASCKITVEATASSDLILSAAALTLKVNQSQQLAATVLPETTTDKTITWASSDPATVSVENGLVTALKAGSATITASNGNLSAKCVVTVEPVVAEQVILDQTSITVNVGSDVTLNAGVYPDDTTDKTIVWNSADPTIATVTNGVVKGVAPGSTIITAECGTGLASCSVTVLQPATSITLNVSSLQLEVGEIYDLIETVSPQNTTDAVVWTSSDPDVATVDENGIVNAIKAGSASITVTCGTQSATCEVTVTDIAAKSITISPENLTLLEGQTSQLSAIVLPENTTNPTVVWTSSNEEVATVAADGTVSALKEGTATITATCGEVSASITVNVTKAQEDQFYLNQTSATLKAEETLQLQATYVSANETDYEVNWTSSNTSVAKVTEEGVVTAVAPGEAVITATCNGKTATCEITVAPTPAEWIELSSYAITLKVNEQQDITATVYPLTTTDSTVAWSTGNTEVATVNDGTVTAVAEGSAAITAMCGDVYATCVVTVESDAPDAIYQPGSEIEADIYTVYTLQGIKVMTTGEKTDLNRLPSGIYIINGKKTLLLNK